MDQKISYIFRKASPSFHSIENVFATIIPEVARQCSVEVKELPFSGGFTAVLRNLLSFRRELNTLYHITGQEYYMALRTGRNTILTIHDIGSAFSNNRLKNGIIRLFWFWLPALIARRITVISEFSRGELIRLIPFAARKIQVIHNPLPPQLTCQPKPFRKEKPVILLIGTKPNKNLERIIPALKDIPCHLVMVGKLSDRQLSLLNECAFILGSDPQPPEIRNHKFHTERSRSAEIRNHKYPTPITDHQLPITDASASLSNRASASLSTRSEGESEKSEIRNPKSEISNPISTTENVNLPIADCQLPTADCRPSTFELHHHLPYSEITALYETCDLLCFASTYEGFGVPILEAQATGRPVITSETSSMPEVAGDGACLVDPFSVASIREGVLKVIRDDDFREELVRNGLKNVERFRADRIAQKYIRIYEEIKMKSANFAN